VGAWREVVGQREEVPVTIATLPSSLPIVCLCVCVGGRWSRVGSVLNYLGAVVLVFTRNWGMCTEDYPRLIK